MRSGGLAQMVERPLWIACGKYRDRYPDSPASWFLLSIFLFVSSFVFCFFLIAFLFFSAYKTRGMCYDITVTQLCTGTRTKILVAQSPSPEGPLYLFQKQFHASRKNKKTASRSQKKTSNHVSRKNAYSIHVSQNIQIQSLQKFYETFNWNVSQQI